MRRQNFSTPNLGKICSSVLQLVRRHGGDNSCIRNTSLQLHKKLRIIIDLHSHSVRVLIIIFINCNWVLTRWQWLFYIYTNVGEGGGELTREFKSGELQERHVVATWKLGNHLSIRLQTRGKHLCIYEGGLISFAST